MMGGCDRLDIHRPTGDRSVSSGWLLSVCPATIHRAQERRWWTPTWEIQFPASCYYLKSVRLVPYYRILDQIPSWWIQSPLCCCVLYSNGWNLIITRFTMSIFLIYLFFLFIKFTKKKMKIVYLLVDFCFLFVVNITKAAPFFGSIILYIS